ncbi:type 1 glutamine amidotransferase [Frigidibacter sp. MR17.24]|uniref:type 1 glutamine amidotransferase n=1 Tax=Frigidibacter sp. MR17.24 TaxID=3127345 RepID=UPI003012CDDA
MLIGILQTGQLPETLRPSLGDYPQMFAALLAHQDLEFRTFHVEAMDFPADVHDCEGWIITGSRHGAYEDHPFIPPLEAFIRRAFEAGVPMVGICFGHQIIAQALGGRVEKFDGGWTVGTQGYDFEGERLVLNAWHQDQVVTLPPGAEIIARGETCAIAGLRWGDRALTVQAHPEFGDAVVEGLMEARARGVVPDALLERAEGLVGSPKDNDVLARKIGAFFRRDRA